MMSRFHEMHALARVLPKELFVFLTATLGTRRVPGTVVINDEIVLILIALLTQEGVKAPQ